MLSISEIAKSKPTTNKIIPKALRVKVAATIEVNSNRIDAAICDSTGAIRAIVYGEDNHKLFIENASLIVRNFQKGEKLNTILVNNKSKINKCTSVKVTNDMNNQAIDIIRPAARPATSIGEIHEDKERLTITGVITQETLNTSPKKVRNLKIEDDSGAMYIALWDNMASSPVKTGDKVTVTQVNARYNRFHKQIALATTPYSTLEIANKVEKKTAEIMGIEATEELDILKITALADDNISEYRMTKDVAISTFNTDDINSIMNMLEKQSHFFITVEGFDVKSAEQKEKDD